MKFLADENFPRPALRALREQGFDVAWVTEDSPGLIDEDVLAKCTSERLTLLTLDKDFGELAFHRGLPAESGVILFRVEVASPSQFADLVVDVLRSREDWSGFFHCRERRSHQDFWFWTLGGSWASPAVLDS